MKTAKQINKIFPAILAFLLCLTARAFALPQGESVETGNATFNRPDANTLNINASDKTVINYNSFNIGAQETVNFNQPGTNASVLNRVLGNAPSSILGKLFANGILFLINTNGINIGASANIQANLFVASTLDISTNNFVNGNYVFEHTPGKIFAQILNKGMIAANNVALIASAVDNQGVIFAKAGRVNLASGDKATVSFDARGYLQVEINAETSGQVISLEDGKPLDTAVANSGTVEAKAVIMTAKTAANIFKQAVNQTGIVKGSGLVEENGTIRIVANKDIKVSGTLEAPNGNIKVISDESVLINNALDLKGDSLIRSNNKDILVNGKITQELGKLSLEAVKGGIYDLNIPIQAKDITLSSAYIKAATEAQKVTVLRDGKNMHLASSTLNGGLVDLEGNDLSLVYPLSGSLTLKTDQAITSEPGVFLRGASVNLSANKFGSDSQPLQLDAPSIYVTRLNGNIDILESQGVGSTMLLRGPPELGAIAFNQDANITLETINGSIKVAKDALIFSKNLSLKSSADIYSQGTLQATQTLSLEADGAITSLGALKADKLVEKGASFLLGGTSDVKSSSIENADGAITYNSGNFSGTYSDAVDIIIGTNAVINLTGNTTFQADSDNNGSGAFIMYPGSSIVGNGYGLTISASYASNLNPISGVSDLTVKASLAGSNPTFTANGVLSASNAVNINSCTLFMNSFDLVANSIVKNGGTLRGANYYVSSSGGNDSATGTSLGKPWRTIAKVNGTSLQPGDNVLFKRGDTWIGEGLVINNSGVSGSPITIGAYGSGANPLFRAARTVSELGQSWSYDSGNIYYITGVNYWLNYAVDSNGKVLWPVGSKGAMTAGTCFFDSGANRLYVWSYAGGTPSTSVIVPSNIGGGVIELKQNQSYINVNNIDIKYANNDGIRISSDYSNINDCSVDYAAGAGFYWFHNWAGAVGADYSQSYRDTARRTNIVGSQAFTVEGSNIWLYDCLAEDNFMAGFDFLDYSSNTNASFSGVVRSISRRNGQRNGSWDPNFYVDGGHDITIDSCWSELAGYNNPNSNSGITVSIENAGHLTYNIVIKNTVSIANKGYALSIGSFTSDKPSNIQLYNNTFIDNTGNWMLIYFEKLGGAGVIMKNNIFYASHGTVLGRWTGADAAYVHSDYNDFYGTSGTAVVIDGANRTFAQWQSTTGQDAHSITADPQFVAGTDDHLSPGSAAIDAGTAIAGITYDHCGAPRTGTLDIGAHEYQATVSTPVSLTVSGITASDKVYDGLTAAAVNYTNAILNGVLSGDIVSLNISTASANFANENAGANKTITIAGLTLSGASASKYTLIQPTATASITPRPLAIGASAANKAYDGTTAASVTLSDNRIPGDSLATSYVSAVFANKNVGSAKTVSITGISLSGTDAANYTYNTTASATANITARPLTVTAASDTRVYNGTTTSSILPQITSGSLASGDSAAFLQSFNNKNAGSGKILTPSGAVNDGNSGANYTVTFVNNSTGAITPATLTLTGISAANKVYDGTTTASVNLGSAALSGIIGSDSVSLNNSSASASFANKNAGSNKAVSISGISLSGTDAANYTLSPTASTTASITARPLTISATGINKVYDGLTAATVNLTDNRISGDILSTVYTANFADKNTGTAKPINVTGITLSGTDSANYTYNTTAATSANITARPITVSAIADTRIYNASVSSSAIPQITSGSLAAGDNASFTQSFNNKNAGTNKTLTPAGSINDGNNGNNYVLTFVNNTSGTITPATLSLTGLSAANKTYDGTTAAIVNFGGAALAGILGSDNVSLNTSSASASFSDKNAGSNKAVSISGFSLSGTDAANYILSPTASTAASITARPLTISSVAANKVYDGTTAASITLSDNRIAGDILNASYAAANFTDKNAANGKTVNVSGISISGTDAANYTYNTTAAATANITARALTVSAAGTDKVYDGTANASVTLSDNRVTGDNLNTSYAAATFTDPNTGTNKTINVSGISVTGPDSANYTFNTITQTTANITAASSGKTYTFTGTGDWLNSLLWSLGAIPGSSDTVIIDGNAYLSGNIAGLNSLTINSGRSLNLAGYNIATTNGITNNGTLYLSGNEAITGSLLNSASSTVEYQGAGTYSGLNAGYSYGNLNFNGSGVWKLGNHLNVSSNITINNRSTLDNNGKNITLSGNLSNNGLLRYSGSGTISLAKGNDATHGTWEFYNSGLIPALDYNNVIISAGTVTAPATTLKIGGNFTHSGGIFNHNNGTIEFNGANQTLTLLPSTKFYNVVFSGVGGSGPAIYLQLDGNSTDASGNNNNGTAYNTSTSTDVAPTNFLNTQSLSFNGSNSYILIPASGSLSGSFTISMWIKPGTSSGTLGLIGSRSPQESSFDAKLQNGNTLHADIGNGSFWITPAADGALAYSANTWYNIVYSVTPSGYEIYANGSRIGQGIFAQSNPLLYDANHNLMIGRTGVSWGEYFNGKIDDVRVYNRALSSAEISALASGSDLGSTKTINGTLQVEGNLTVNPGVTLNANNQNISVGGNWTNNGTFISGTSTVTLSGTGLQQIITGGANSKFNILTVTNNSVSGVTFADALYTGTLNAANGVKKLSFATGSGVVHTVTNSLNLSGASGNLLKLAPATAGLTWYLNAPVSTVRYTDVSYCSQAAGKLITALNSTDSGNNANWKFASSTLTFSGTGDWLNALLWSVGVIPSAGDTVIIDGSCTLSANTPLLNSLTINSGRSLNLAGYNLSTTAGLTNNGALYLLGSETIAGNIINSAASTVEYRGGANYSGLAAGYNYGNLNFNGSGTWKLGNNLAVSGNLTINSGALDNNIKNITLAGSLYNNSRIRYSGSGTISLAKGNDADSGTWEFYGTGSIPGFDYNNIIISGGTVTAPAGTLKVFGNFTHSGGAFNHNNGTVDFAGKNQTLTLLSSTKFYNVIFSGATGTGPLIYLALDGNASDSSGNGNNGTTQNTASSTDAAPTNFLNAQSLSFNGSNAYITIPSSGSLSGTFTISLWIKPETTSGTLGLIGSRTPSDCAFDLKLQNGSTLHGDIGTGSYWITPQADGTFNYSAGNWYNIVYAVTPTGYSIYANAKLVGSGSFGAGTPLLYDANHNLTVGFTGSWGEYFNGKIDDLRVYNRALTSSEIAALAAGTELGATKNITGAPLQVVNNLTINPGVRLISNNQNISVGGNWTNNGVFTAGSNTVTLNGTKLQQVKTGGASSKFNILTVTNTSSNGVTFTDALFAGTLNATSGVKKLSFATGSNIVHTITNSLNLSGTSGSLLKLAPATAGQNWYLNAPVSTLRYVDVSYSRQTAGKLITALYSRNGGNNLNWAISP